MKLVQCAAGQLLSLLLVTSAIAQAPGRQSGPGKFARNVSVPDACVSLRQLPPETFADYGNPVPAPRHGPACRTLFQCGVSVRAQSRELIEYLQNHPSLNAALEFSYKEASYEPPTPSRKRYETYDKHKSGLKYGLLKWPDERFDRTYEASEQRGCKTADCCLVDFQMLTSDSPNALLPDFEELARVGRALLTKVRSEYNTDSEIFRNLISSNDRYTGVEAFERAFAAYREAAENDDVAEMIDRRTALLKSFEVAKARKDFLTQQSRQIATYKQSLSDIGASIQHDDLTKFFDVQTANGMDQLRNDVEHFSQTTPARRGDIAADLEVIASRIRDLDPAIASARERKRQAEQTRHNLAEQEGQTKQVLDAATSAELSPAFDEQSITSIRNLMGRFGELRSVDLWVIGGRRYCGCNA